jgi:predicted transcriptional regulator
MADENNKTAVSDNAVSDGEHNQEELFQPLISLASALIDMDRLRIVAQLVNGPANRMELAEATGLPQRELLRQLGLLQYFGLVQYKQPAPQYPGPDALLVLNEEAFRTARQAMGKLRGSKPRPTNARLMTLETFMPGGKLAAFPLKKEQILVVLDEIATKFEPDRQYKERDVNVILEDVNEDYCTLRRYLVDYGYLKRHAGVYTKSE